MPDNFKPVTENKTPSEILKFQIGKLYGEAFPSLANQALFKIEGAKDLVKQEVTDKIGYGFKIPTESAPATKIDWSGVQVADIDEGNVLSYLGLPVFQTIKLLAGSYYVLNNGIATLKEFPNDLVLPLTSTAQFVRSKVIAKTLINGGDGTVKEMWAFTDWEVTIRGLIMTEGDHQGNNSRIFPATEASKIMEYENITDSVEVSGLMFNLLKIKRIAIEKVDVSQVVGKPNIIPFQMNCSSDQPIEFIIKNNQLGN